VAAVVVEELMPRFYFHLTSKESRIPDDSGNEFDTLNDAYEHARKLIDKILFYAGFDDANEWKVIISNDQNDAQIIVPFPVSSFFRRSAYAI
jgi:hypothetical protein